MRILGLILAVVAAIAATSAFADDCFKTADESRSSHPDHRPTYSKHYEGHEGTKCWRPGKFDGAGDSWRETKKETKKEAKKETKKEVKKSHRRHDKVLARADPIIYVPGTDPEIDEALKQPKLTPLQGKWLAALVIDQTYLPDLIVSANEPNLVTLILRYWTHDYEWRMTSVGKQCRGIAGGRWDCGFKEGGSFASAD